MSSGSEKGRPSGAAVVHDRATRFLSGAMLVLGVLFLYQAVAAAKIYAAVLGVLFLAAGAGRLYVQLRRGPGSRGN